MKVIVKMLVFLIVIAVAYQFVNAEVPLKGDSKTMSGNAKKGEEAFNDVKFAGGKAGKKCSECHAKGKGFEGLDKQQKYKVLDKEFSSIEEAANFCIQTWLQGIPLVKDSTEMKDLVTYVRLVSYNKQPSR
ncbi:MAG: hypothetical protein HQK99_10135 [Nitrospirae bacterium]|nr:hypothetical protein [Nitrospirota bacterium]